MKKKYNKDTKSGEKALKAIRNAVEAAEAENRPVRILFVCLGNICRSPAAEGIMRSLAEKRGMGNMLEIDSAGFYGGHAGDLPDYRMRQAAFARGLRLDHRSCTVRPTDFGYFDLFVGMDDRNIADLHRAAPTIEEEEKIIRMSDFAVNHPYADCVPDPYYEGAAGFELVLNLLEDACSEMLDRIAQIN